MPDFFKRAKIQPPVAQEEAGKGIVADLINKLRQQENHVETLNTFRPGNKDIQKALEVIDGASQKIEQIVQEPDSTPTPSM